MNNNYGTDTQYPTVNLAVKKSRLKLYDNRSESPTYFLNKGQEFQIELFNPTTYTLLAKIKLNGNAISGGGLVLRPGERIFLERFLEENKKFLFDTYQVDNIAAVKKAIKENGDLVVDFYKEKQLITQDLHAFHGGTNSGYYGGIMCGSTINFSDNSTGSVTLDSLSIDASNVTTNLHNTSTTNTVNFSHDLDSLDFAPTSLTRGVSSSATIDIQGTLNINGTVDKALFSSTDFAPVKKKSRRRITKSLKSKSIETGRVTKGSVSNQQLDEVELDFEWNVFHSVEYKMLPLSQKTYDSKEIKQRYCGDCGKKLKPTHKFCPNCGEEQ